MSAFPLRVFTDAPSVHAPIEPATFGRIPLQTLSDPEVSDAECRVLLAIVVAIGRGESTTDTDGQLGMLCGKSAESVQRSVRGLAEKGLIDRSGGGRYRRLALAFRFKAATDRPPSNSVRSDGVDPPPTPSEVTANPVRSDGQLRHFCLPTPSEVTAPYKRGKEKNAEKPAASSRPRDVATPPPAGTKTGTPPTSARPPIVEAREREAADTATRDAAIKARWDELPPADRAAIEAEVRAADPVLSTFPPMFRSLCLAAMEARPGPGADQKAPAAIDKPAITAPVIDKLPAVEVLPTDREIGSLKFLADATNPFMRAFARIAIRDAGRDDLIDPQAPEKEPAGRPLSGPPAGS